MGSSRPLARATVLFVTGALALGLGLGTTIAVAWALAAWLPHGRFTWTLALDPLLLVDGERGSSQRIQVDSFARPGMVRRTWFIQPMSAPPLPSSVFIAYFGSSRWGRGPGEIDRGWGEVPCLPALSGRSWGVEDARGWPMPSLWCDIGPGPVTGQLLARGGIPVSPPNVAVADYRALPCRPHWLGLGIDSALYALPWAAALAVLRWHPLRTWRRRRRGHCPACGYDLAGLPACPECGRARA